MDQDLKSFVASELGTTSRDSEADEDTGTNGPARALARDLMTALKDEDEDGVTDAILAIWLSAQESKDALTDKE